MYRTDDKLSCPHCGNRISRTATLCVYCNHTVHPGEATDATPPGQLVPAVPPARRSPNGSRRLFGRSTSDPSAAVDSSSSTPPPADAAETPPGLRSTTNGRVARKCENCGREVDARARVCVHCQLRFSRPRTLREGMPVSTSGEIPGFAILDYVGEVYGVVLRSRASKARVGAARKRSRAGEMEELTLVMLETRQAAVERMVEEALERGADGVIGLRFEVAEVDRKWAEVCAYGTAVRLRPSTAIGVESRIARS
jgi:uncharacterized protein YbjQ (UPF0145 family)